MSNVKYIGPSIGSLLGVAFIVLKLCGVINWSWVWVLAPFWIGWGIMLLMLGFALVALLVAFLVAVWLDKKN